MKLSKNVVCWSITLGVVTGFMAGCSGGFKSKTFSDKEIAAYMKNLRAQENPDDPLKAEPTVEQPETPLADTAGTDPVLTNTNTTPDLSLNGNINQPVIPVDAAGSKVIAEEAPLVADFLSANNAQLMAKNPGAAKFVRGITIDISAGASASVTALQISVRAIVQVEGLIESHVDDGTPAPLFLSALNAPLAYIAAPGTVPPITVTLQKTETDTSGIAPLDYVILAGACVDEGCTDVQVRMRFKDTDRFQEAVFHLGLQDGKYVMLENNLTDTQVYKTYEEAVQEIKDLVVEAQAASGAMDEPTSADVAPVAEVAGDLSLTMTNTNVGNVNAPVAPANDLALTNTSAPAVANRPRTAATGDIAGLVAKIKADEAAAAAAAATTGAAGAPVVSMVRPEVVGNNGPRAAAATVAPPRAAATGDVAGLMAQLKAEEAAKAAAATTVARPRAAATGDIAGLVARLKAEEAAKAAAAARQRVEPNTGPR